MYPARPVTGIIDGAEHGSRRGTTKQIRDLPASVMVIAAVKLMVG